MRRAIREHLRDFLAIITLAVVAILTLLVIFYNQKAAFPSWFPVLGQNFYELNAEFSTAQAVTPGQGQAVQIAGINVGKVGAVSLENGKALVRMDIESKYAQLIHRNAHLLLRPKTGLNDMVVQVDPGTRGATPAEGSTIPLSQTQPNVNPDEFLATLDADTRDYLALLLDAGAQGLGGHSRQFSADLKRFQPLSRDLAKIGVALAVRRQNISRSIHNFSLILQELGNNDQQLTRFVDSSNAVLGTFADQQQALRQALRELPPTLRVTKDALARSTRFSKVLRPAALRLIPASQALKPALEASQRLFRETRGPIQNQIRPFTRQIRPVIRHLNQTSKPLFRTAKGLRGSFTDLNTLLNELAYNPPGSKQEGYLFYLPWLNHDFNAIHFTQDAEGPVRRGLLIISCGTARLAEITAGANDLLKTELQATQLPRSVDICPPSSFPIPTP
jgi:phospholipid/cholesterol/gamma-HCH transport system substrate-binding protein